MPLYLDVPGGWYDLGADAFSAGNQVVEDLLVSLNSLIRFAATADEYVYGGGVVGSAAGETIALGDGVTRVFVYTVRYPAIQPGTLMIAVNGAIARDNGAGAISGAGLPSATVDYASGLISLTFPSALSSSSVITCAYLRCTKSTAATETAGTGNASTVNFSHTLALLPAMPGSITVRAGAVVAADNGVGAITGTGVSGTVNYLTGAVSLTFTAAPASGIAVTVSYDQALGTSGGGVKLGTGGGRQTYWAAALAHPPVLAGSVIVAAGLVIGTDNGASTISGAGVTGTINYTTGAIRLTFSAAPAIGIQVCVSYVQVRQQPTPFAHGNTIPTPRSADDGYAYSRAECLYAFAMAMSPNASTGVNGGAGNLLMVRSYVEQDTGVVDLMVDYYVQGGQETATSDGAVSSIVICRRGAGAAMAIPLSTGGGVAGGGGGSSQLATHGDPVIDGGQVNLA